MYSLCNKILMIVGSDYGTNCVLPAYPYFIQYIVPCLPIVCHELNLIPFFIYEGLFLGKMQLTIS